MTKVKVDVTITATGSSGSGKSQLTTQILKAIKSDPGLSKIAKVMQGTSYEGLSYEQTTIRFEGDLAKQPVQSFEQGQEVRHGIFEFRFANSQSIYAWKPDGSDEFKGSSYSITVAMMEQKIFNETKGPYAWKEPTMNAPSPTYSNVPGYPNADAMLSYLTDKISNTGLASDLKDPKAHAEGLELLNACTRPAEKTVISSTDKTGKRTEYKPIQVYVSVTGVLATKPRYPGARAITLLAAVEPNPVGKGQDKPEQAESVGSGAALGMIDRTYMLNIQNPGPRVGGSTKTEVEETLKQKPDETYSEWRTRLEMIKDQWGPAMRINEHTADCNNNAFIRNDGECICDYVKRFYETHDKPIQGIATMERFPGETDAEYCNRNKIPVSAIIPDYVPLTESAAPKPDAHNKALDVLLMFLPSITDQFQPVTYEKCVYPGGLVAGDTVQVIFDDGAILIGKASSFSWCKGQTIADMVYYRKL